MKQNLLLLLVLTSCHLVAQHKLPSFNTPPPGVTLLGEGFISTSLNERDFALSPDGKEIYFTISSPRSLFQTIVSSRQNQKGEWSQPEVVSFAGSYSDLEPAFSPDGNTLFFASNRPLTGSEPKDFDIWMVTRTATGWSEPVNAGSPVNTSADEFYPSITRSGNLYFTATYKNGPGREDIYVAKRNAAGFETPVALDTMVNSKFYEFNAFVDPDEQFILFTSYGRKDDSGGGDLYLSRKDASGKWTMAVNVKRINSPQLDYCPYVTPDGKSLIFTSERHTLPRTFIPSRATYKSVGELNKATLNATGNLYWVAFAIDDLLK